MTKSSGRRNLGGMTTVNIYDAKARLSALIAEAEAGGDVIIARAGQPVVRLVRVDTHRQPRIPGLSAKCWPFVTNGHAGDCPVIR